jgi:ribosome maturation factor RimP
VTFLLPSTTHRSDTILAQTLLALNRQKEVGAAWSGRKVINPAASRLFFFRGAGRLSTKDGHQERIERVRRAVNGVVTREGFELIDVELAIEHGRSILRIYIDTVPPGTKERGVTVEHCQHVSRIVGDLLDVEDIIDVEYNLEVSSPGIFRPLTKPEHYERALGERIKVKTYEKRDGRKVFTGVLKAKKDGELVIEIDGKDFVVPVQAVAKANLEPLL